VTKILVVEDEESVLDPLELLLTKEGFSIITARDGKEALEKFDQSSPDLILLDLMLPEISGTQV
jgi:DNA-binding response OmpR family regulator